jgi:hypothetical protein
LAIALPAALWEQQGFTHTGRFVDLQLFNISWVVLPRPGYITTKPHRSSGKIIWCQGKNKPPRAKNLKFYMKMRFKLERE